MTVPTEQIREFVDLIERQRLPDMAFRDDPRLALPVSRDSPSLSLSSARSRNRRAS